jgi:hypothetical protein
VARRALELPVARATSTYLSRLDSASTTHETCDSNRVGRNPACAGPEGGPCSYELPWARDRLRAGRPLWPLSQLDHSGVHTLDSQCRRVPRIPWRGRARAKEQISSWMICRSSRANRRSATFRTNVGAWVRGTRILAAATPLSRDGAAVMPYCV